MNFEALIEIKVTENGGFYRAQIFLDGNAFEYLDGANPQEALDLASIWLQRHCRKCGCSLLGHCAGGEDLCHWVEKDLCSNCLPENSRPLASIRGSKKSVSKK